MSQVGRLRSDSARVNTQATLPDRELSDAELESISAAGALKGPPDDPHKKPEPPKNP